MRNIKFISEWEPAEKDKKLVYFKLIEFDGLIALRIYEDQNGHGQNLLTIEKDGKIKLCQLGSHYSKNDFGIEVDENNYPSVSKNKTIKETKDENKIEEAIGKLFMGIVKDITSDEKEKNEKKEPVH